VLEEGETGERLLGTEREDLVVVGIGVEGRSGERGSVNGGRVRETRVRRKERGWGIKEEG